MPEAFDPYRKWLGIKPEEQPPDHYRLLGISLFESDPDVIANAADARMAYIRTFQAGAHADLSQKLLNELAAARVCLLVPAKKADYDAELRELFRGAPVALPVGASATAVDSVDPQVPIIEAVVPRGFETSPRPTAPKRRLISRRQRTPLMVLVVSLGVLVGLVTYIKMTRQSRLTKERGGSVSTESGKAPSTTWAPVDQDADQVSGQSDRSDPNESQAPNSQVPFRPDPDPRQVPAGSTARRQGAGRSQAAAGAPRLLPPGGISPQPSAPQARNATAMRMPGINGAERATMLPASGARGLRPGLWADYFYDDDFQQPVLSRVDSTMEHSWGEGSFAPGYRPERFWARWTGWLIPPAPGKYKLVVRADDGVRVWIDGKPMANAWRTRNVTQQRDFDFAARPHAVRVEYFKSMDRGELSWRWVPPGETEPRPIPAAAFAFGRRVDLATPDQIAVDLARKRFEKIVAAFKPLRTRSVSQSIIQTAIAAADDTAAQLALLQDAMRLATNAPDFCEAVNEMDLRFQVDGLHLKAQGLATRLKKMEESENIHAVLLLMFLMEQAIDQDRWDVVNTLEQTIRRVMKWVDSATTPWLVRRTQLVLDDLREQRMAYDSARPYLHRQITEADPVASLVVGRYYCFVKGEWERGLPLLAQSNEQELARTASLDLEGAKPSSTDAALEAGSRWIELSNTFSGIAKKRTLCRGLELYAAALPSVADAVRERLEGQLVDMAAAYFVAKPTAWHVNDDFVILHPDGSCHRDRKGTWKITRNLIELDSAGAKYTLAVTPDYQAIRGESRLGLKWEGRRAPLPNGKL